MLELRTFMYPRTLPEHVCNLQVISTALGYVLPNLISRKATQHAASVLYTFFGLRLLYIAWTSKPQDTNQVCACSYAVICKVAPILALLACMQPSGPSLWLVMQGDCVHRI